MSGARRPGDVPRDQASGEIGKRKRDHLDLALHADVGFPTLRTGLDEVRVRSRALPERDLADVDLRMSLWGRELRAPLLISCMTGGVSEAGDVNRALAVAAQRHRVVLGLGSGRALLENRAVASTYNVRDVAPDVPVLANLGAGQLAEYNPHDCARLVDLCAADALVVHLNAVHEAVQVRGHTGFGGVLGRIEDLCAALDVPVVVKEVGFGISPEDAAALVAAGVAGLDVAGAGGTNWARLEGHRDARMAAVAEAFADWGWPTVESVRAGRTAIDTAGTPTVLIGSGGLRHGVDALKVLCLGADLAGFARALLPGAAAGPDAATEAVGVLVDQLRISAWASGAATADDLGPDLLVSPKP